MNIQQLIMLLTMALERGGNLEVRFASDDENAHRIDNLVCMQNKYTNDRVLIITNDKSGMGGIVPKINFVNTGSEH